MNPARPSLKCKAWRDYTRVKSIGEGVALYRPKEGDDPVAIKKQLIYETSQINPAALREATILKLLLGIDPYTYHVLSSSYFIMDPPMGKWIGFVMPLATSDLAGALKEKSLHPKNYRKYVYQMLYGLAYLHSLDIIHRDLKPENVLYDKNHDVMIIADFGLSRALSCASVSGTTHYIATLPYRSPELVLGGQRYSHAYDIWSMGCIIYEMLVGKDLFPLTQKQFDTKHLFAIMVARLGRPTSDLWPDVYDYPHASWIPKGSIAPKRPAFPLSDKIASHALWTTFLKRMLEWDPARRPTAHQLLEATLFSAVRRGNEPETMTCIESMGQREIAVTRDRWQPHEHVTVARREELLVYLLHACLSFDFSPDTFFLGCHLLDTYLPKDITPANLTLWGVACMNVASVYEEVMFPSLSEWARLLNDPTWSRDELRDMSLLVLQHSEFDLIRGTSLMFVREYGRIAYTVPVTEWAIHFLYLGLRQVFHWSAREQALWAIYYACQYQHVAYEHDHILHRRDIERYRLKSDPWLKKIWIMLPTAISWSTLTHTLGI